MEWIFFVIGALTLAVGYVLGRDQRLNLRPAAAAVPSPPAPVPAAAPLAAGPPAAPPDPKQVFYETAEAAYEDFQRAARPSHLLGSQGFEACVEAMRTSPLSGQELLGFYTGDVMILAVCAAEALARRPPEAAIRTRLLQTLNDFHPYTRFFGLRAIAAATPATESTLGLVLSSLDESWNMPPLRPVLADFVAERLAAGETPRLHGMPAEPDDATCGVLQSLLAPIQHPDVAAFLAELAELQAGRVDEGFLRSLGLLATRAGDEVVVDHPAFRAARLAVEAAVTGVPPRPVLLVGAPGTGRATVVEAVWRALCARGWKLFRAGHMELIAGQSYVGQLEAQVRRLLDELSRARRTLWVAPAFQSFLFAGRHQNNPTSLIDLLQPALAEGRFPLIAVTEPAGLDLLARNKPELLTAFEVVRLEPLAEAESLAVAREWDRHRDAPPDPCPEPLLREAAHLAQQYLGDRAAPGNLIHLLKAVQRDLAEAGRSTPGVDDLITTVSRLTRLPSRVLDERQVLDLAHLKAFFAARVMGQPEAIDTLVERVAMIKAGVTDPTRPLGVFLFAGPTGTGKTEIAKALAEYLFGSAQRLVRLDMSELQTPESLARLLGEGERDSTGNALVDEVRRNPFSVVLLDEFEKSHPQVWDLFLQVFDDGRLTDRRGVTADFRNCIIILTSNLGSTLPTGPGLGFGGGPRFTADSVEQAVARAFRREFFNRIDRVVVFRPLTREVLRDILRKELRDVFGRRGLRNRDWVVVWDETAIDFLLDRGTTPDLGARPLKRAIEQHVLAPLARTIVEHQVPRGDQFLFVRRDGERLEAEFVDPDAEVAAPAAPAPARESTRLEALALDPRGTDDEVPCLERHLEALATEIDSEAWRSRKRQALERQREPGFWDSPDRFAVYGLIEQMDRVEAGVRTATQLFDKLRGGRTAGRTRLAGEHTGRLALRLFLLETAVADVHAERPLDAFLSIETADAGDPRRAAATAFRGQLLSMYRCWADRRGLKFDQLLVDDEAGRPPRVIVAVSGLAAHTLLAAEDGLHLLEEPAAEGRSFDRVQLRVRVAPQPDIPPADGSGGLRAQAVAAFENRPAAVMPVVRRYRERPSPLVRDTVRGWRTGRLDRVYGGDFDLLTATTEGEPGDDA